MFFVLKTNTFQIYPTYDLLLCVAIYSKRFLSFINVSYFLVGIYFTNTQINNMNARFRFFLKNSAIEGHGGYHHPLSEELPMRCEMMDFSK